MNNFKSLVRINFNSKFTTKPHVQRLFSPHGMKHQQTSWKPRFSLCELFFLLGFFLLMFLNSQKKMQWYVMFEKKTILWMKSWKHVLFVCRSSYQVPNLQGHSGRWPYLACLCWSFPGKNKWYISRKSGPNHHPIEYESNWIKPCQHWTWKIIEITHTYYSRIAEKLPNGWRILWIYIYISIHVYVLKLSMFYLYCILYLLNIKYKHCISYVYIIYIYINYTQLHLTSTMWPTFAATKKKKTTPFHTSNFRGTTGESEIAHMKPWV